MGRAVGAAPDGSGHTRAAEIQPVASPATPAALEPAGITQSAVPQHRGEGSASFRPASQGLVCRTGSDGSFSLWSEAFGEGFHSARGALREARETFLIPSQLERFPAGSRITVLEVCVGTGSNLAVLLEACEHRGLQLDWIGLELEEEPLRLALSQPAFRAPWQPNTLAVLEHLLERGEWHGSAARFASHGETHDPELRASHARMLWGDARRTLPSLVRAHVGPFDLIWHDAFSPQRCPQLWTLEFLTQLTALLRPDGRWISYSSAAAVRETLRLANLQLAALPAPSETMAHQQLAWSGGTLASPIALPDSPLWRPLTAMELEHLACAAGEPYRDSMGSASATAIIVAREQAQASALARGSRGSSSAWRRRWGVEPSQTTHPSSQEKATASLPMAAPGTSSPRP